jgi:ketosteroid isomerase-like protein
MSSQDLSKAIEYYMTKGYSKEDAEAAAMAQYADDCLIFATIDGILNVKKEFPEVVMQISPNQGSPETVK